MMFFTGKKYLMTWKRLCLYRMFELNKKIGIFLIDLLFTPEITGYIDRLDGDENRTEEKRF